MEKIIVVSYCKLTSNVHTMTFDTLKIAHKYILDNIRIDLENNEYNSWFYYIIKIKL